MLFVRARFHQSTSSLQYNGSFHNKYIYERIPLEQMAEYLENPVIGHYIFLECDALVAITITPSKFSVSVEAADGYQYEKSYSIGEDIVYLGNNVFWFYSSDLSLGQLLPGTSYAETVCKIEVSAQAVSIEAEEERVGLGFFLIPQMRKTTFRKSLRSQSGLLGHVSEADD